MRLSAMGDVAMTVPVLRALTAQHPNIRLTVISRTFFKPFFDGIPNVDFFPFDEKERHKGILGLLQLYWDLKPLGIDAFADLHNVIRSNFIRKRFALTGKKTAFTDKGRTEKRRLTELKNKTILPLPTMFERHAETFRKLGYPIDLSHPVFPPKQNMEAKVIEITGDKNNKKWIGIAPFAQYDSKVYPIDLMQEVIHQLSQNPQHQLFLFGGGHEEIEQLNALAENRQNIVMIAGKLHLQQELQLISNLDVMLSMDSGNAHIAAMFGVKTITLWGATHPFAGFSPFDQPLENAITSDRNEYPFLPTSIYGNKKVSGYENAMRTIMPEKVVYSIQSQLAK